MDKLVSFNSGKLSIVGQSNHGASLGVQKTNQLVGSQVVEAVNVS